MKRIFKNEPIETRKQLTLIAALLDGLRSETAHVIDAETVSQFQQLAAGLRACAQRAA
jgi:hypothetical protein